ncbi:MAG TPA: hypothetical protein VGH28_34095 [Polyangiaceae bacterium]|jgi:ActR/RegA family two-component response regulator
MTPDDADLLLALEAAPEVEAVYEMPSARPGWPRLFVALRSDDAYALGRVTALIVRALPHRDRAYIGIAATERLRELWLPLGAPLGLTRAQRVVAEARAERRELEYAREDPAIHVRLDPERAPLSVPVMTPFSPRRVWTLSDRTVVVLEVVADPFRTPTAPLLVVTDDDALFARIARTAPKTIPVERARTAAEAIEAIRKNPPLRIVSAERLALEAGGLLDWIETERRDLAARLEVVCHEGTSDWIAQLLESRRTRPSEILEEPLEDEAIDEVVARAKRDAR